MIIKRKGQNSMKTAVKKKQSGSKPRKGSVCKACSAPCCRNLAMMITKPRTRTDINELKWYLHFDTVDIFIRNHKWYLMIKGKCIYLNRNKLCKIYARRPQMCRRHQPPDCERFGKWYDILISTPDKLESYLNGGRK